MKNRITSWTGLLLLCVLVLGCSDAAPDQPEESTSPIEQTADTTLAMVVETSQTTYWVDGTVANAIDDVRTMVQRLDEPGDTGYMITVDEEFQREGQLRIVLTAVAGNIVEIDLKAESDRLFDTLKQDFDQHAKDAAMQEEAHYRELAKATAAQVKVLQEELQDFIQITRGVPQNDASKLERRKLDRRVETALIDQIAAEKAVHKTELRNDRERFVTLLRLR